MPRPHDLFRVWSPDSVAECLDGVTDDLSRKLWRLVEDLPEPNEVNDNFASRALSKRWSLLTPDDQTLLNKLAKRQELFDELRAHPGMEIDHRVWSAADLKEMQEEGKIEFKDGLWWLSLTRKETSTASAPGE